MDGVPSKNLMLTTSVTTLTFPIQLGNNGPPYLSQQRVISKFSPKDFVPDGDISKREWSASEKVTFDTSYLPGENFPEAITEVATLWTGSYFYVAFWSKYTELFTYLAEDISQERWGLWDRDVVEVFVNPFPEQANIYRELQVAPNNQWVDLAIDLDQDPFYDVTWNSGFDHATKVDEKSRYWCCEMRIPLASLGVDQISPGMQWRINFYRADGPGDDTKRKFLAWSPTAVKTFHAPARFGLLSFEKQENSR